MDKLTKEEIEKSGLADEPGLLLDPYNFGEIRITKDYSREFYTCPNCRDDKIIDQYLYCKNCLKKINWIITLRGAGEE